MSLYFFAMIVLSPTGAANIIIYSFDTFVVALMVYGFCRRMKESHISRRFIMNNWYELPAMIPIVIFASAWSIDTYDGIITLVAIFRLLALIYVIRISRSLEDKSRILGGHTTLQVFVIFFLTLNILAFLFYSVEHPVENSQIDYHGRCSVVDYPNGLNCYIRPRSRYCCWKNCRKYYYARRYRNY